MLSYHNDPELKDQFVTVWYLSTDSTYPRNSEVAPWVVLSTA